MPSELKRFSGELIWPTDAAYEASRLVYNRRVNSRPALIARCRDNMDVMDALRWANERDLEVSVRSAGNNYNGFSTSAGGVVIDLSFMRSARVDPMTRSARIGGGTHMGDPLREASLHGLAPAIGVGGAVGVGLVLGGGFGYLRNVGGWSADNILSADLVTADGQLVRANRDENPDLLWALRGAGANFGVVTSLELQLHSMPRQITAGTLHWNEARLEEGMRAIRDVMAVSSDNLSVTSWLALSQDPIMGIQTQSGAQDENSRIPACLEVHYAHFGPPEQAAKEIAHLLNDGRADVEHSGPDTFVELHYRWSPMPKRMNWDAVSASFLSDEVISVMANIARTTMGMAPGASRCIELFDLRGAPSREPALGSAQPRSLPAAWSLRPGASATSPEFDESNGQWVLDTMDAILATDVGIPDYCALNSTSWIPTAERVRTHYGAALPRLIELKRKWDPQNVFRKNQNIDPNWQ